LVEEELTKKDVKKTKKRLATVTSDPAPATVSVSEPVTEETV